MSNHLTNSKDMLTYGMISRFPGSKFPQTSSRRICLTPACPAFSSSFFSQPYDLPLPQRLSFDNDLNCPYRGRPHHMSRVSPVFATLTKTTGGWGTAAPTSTHKPDTSATITSPANPSLSIGCGRFPSPIGGGGSHTRNLFKFYFRSSPCSFDQRSFQPSNRRSRLRALLRHRCERHKRYQANLHRSPPPVAHGW